MALNSALYTGLSGLDVAQTQINVIGNNIANVNTTAFKTSDATFKSQFYVTDSAGTASDTDNGGANPSQRGLGAAVSSIQQDFTPGSIQTTGKNTDLAVDGDGFFVVKNAGKQHFTRDGSFSLNSDDQLVNANGAFVQGFSADSKGNISQGQLGNITIPLGTTTTAQATSSASLQGNLDASGAISGGASILTSQLLTVVGGGTAPDGTTLLTNLASTSADATPLFAVGDKLTLAGQKGGRDLSTTTFTVTTASTVSDLNNFFNEGLATNTGVTSTPPPGATIETDTADPTSARFVLTGNAGTENAIQITGSDLVNQGGTSPLAFADGTNAAGVKSDPSGESVHTSFVAYDSLGTPLNIDMTAVLQSKADSGNTWQFFVSSPDNQGGSQVVGSGTLKFDANGKLTSTTGTALTIDRTGTGATTPMSVSLDFSTMTQLTGSGSQIVMDKQDGFPIGSLSSFSVGDDGKVTGAYSNGINRTLGQVAVATFKNNEGLNTLGGNLYDAGAASGVAVISAPGELGAGAVRSGSLEQSNVDISKEFTKLIIASTGFSASSRVISTSDQLLTELLNSSR